MSRTSNNSSILMEVNPGSPSSEAYRSLRFNIECTMSDQQAKVLVVTSAVRGEGRTTTAVNLAVAYAQIGKKVLLMDADLRNPSIHLAFGKDNSSGLTSYLTHKCNMKEIIRESSISNLSMILSGPPSHNSVELLASKTMDELLDELKVSFDLIIIDTPSVLMLTDAKITAAKSDGVVLVVRYGKLKRETAKKVKEELMLAKAKLIGVVMNKINNQDADAYMRG